MLNRRDLRNQWNLLQSFAPFPGFAASATLPSSSASITPAPLEWTRDGEDFRVMVEGRAWRLHPATAPDGTLYELAVDGALGLDLDAWPPFWRVRESEQ
jgi:hypothetical protein